MEFQLICILKEAERIIHIMTRKHLDTRSYQKKPYLMIVIGIITTINDEPI
jgi:hypothetical protein